MTDGVPTLDLTGYSYDHWDVSAVEVMISEGVFRSPSQVRTSVSITGIRTGMPGIRLPMQW